MTRSTLTIISAAGLLVAVLSGYLAPIGKQTANAASFAAATTLDPECHVCSLNDEHFDTQDGGCTDLQTNLVWGTHLGTNSEIQYC